MGRLLKSAAQANGDPMPRFPMVLHLSRQSRGTSIMEQAIPPRKSGSRGPQEARGRASLGLDARLLARAVFHSPPTNVSDRSREAELQTNRNFRFGEGFRTPAPCGTVVRVVGPAFESLL